MNGFEEVQEYVKSFIHEKQQVQQQISAIETKRTQLAEIKNIKKSSNGESLEVKELGRKISELGKQSQELQNQLDFNMHGIKSQVNMAIDNLVAEGVRKIRISNGEIQDLESKIEKQRERQEKYQLQKQEFYLRFGRMPELSEKVQKENQNSNNAEQIEELTQKIKQIQEELSELALAKRNLKNGNWHSIVEKEKMTDGILKIEPVCAEELEIIPDIYVEEFEPVEELYVEEFQPIEEIVVESFDIEEFVETELPQIEMIKELEPETEVIEEIEELARKIVEEIAAEQTQNYSVNKVEEKQEEIFINDIITFEDEEEKKDQIIIPLFGKKATISNIVVKFEDGNLVYKAQMSDDKEIKIYPAQLGEENVLLRDKQNRQECKEILINYAISEYKTFDKKVVNKIDPLICELLIECAERYGYDAQELVYNYAMSFVNDDSEGVPGIVYNLSYIEQSNLSRKEKSIINKIVRNARKNSNIDIIEAFAGYRKIKYVLKRLFAVNNVKVLPEAKY